MPTTRTSHRRALSLLAVVPLAVGARRLRRQQQRRLRRLRGVRQAPPTSSASATSPTSPTPPALIGVQEGLFAKELGDTKLTTQVFNAGPDEVEALFGGAIDAAYIGPSPTINAYGQSDGDAIRIIAGAASGGAQLVVRDGIDSAADLKGTTLASPAARQHPGRRAAHLAHRPGPEEQRRRRRRRHDRADGQQPTSSTCSRAASSTAPGCPSPTPRGWCSRAAATCWSTRRTCGRTASSSPRT